MGRGFIKIPENWQFGLAFNIPKYIFFCFAQKKNQRKPNQINTAYKPTLNLEQHHQHR
jgi:hypothetical protein